MALRLEKEPKEYKRALAKIKCRFVPMEISLPAIPMS